MWPRPGVDDPDGPGGPEGCQAEQHQVYEGDLIQYDWDNNGYWNHSAIIVRSMDLGQDNRYHWIAAHTEDVDNYPFTEYLHKAPNMVYRFIHIERIDGYVMCYLPLVMRQ